MRALDALLALTALDRLPRTGWLLAGVAAPESIAAHSLGAALVVLALGEAIEPPLDVERAAVLALVHDAPEAWLGDLPRPGAAFLPSGAKRAAEHAIAERLLGGLSPLALARFGEFEAGASREARFARVCEKLHLGVALLGYVRAGQRGLEELAASVAGLDCGEFPACETLRQEILAAL